MKKSKNKETILQKNNFLLKTNKILNFRIEDGLLKDSFGEILGNPFDRLSSFSYYNQIFLPEIDNNVISIYKSTLEPNTFLLMPKKYYVTRDIETDEPCIRTIFHVNNEDSGLQDISQIQFLFSVGPNLSNFDEASLKIALKDNQFLDNKKEIVNIIEEVKFLYPNHVGANYKLIGDSFIESADVVRDGKYFGFSLTTQSISTASLFMNSINNQISRIVNISFEYKEINEFCTININLDKTIGEALLNKIDYISKKIIIKNCSLSSTRLLNMLFIFEDNKAYFNKDYFTRLPYLKPNKTLRLPKSKLYTNEKKSKVRAIYINHESIEDIELEFEQIVDSSTSFIRYITINIKTPQKENINKISIKVKVEDSQNSYNFIKLRKDFSKPILFNFILKVSKEINSKIFYETSYFDSEENIVDRLIGNVDYNSTSNILIS